MNKFIPRLLCLSFAFALTLAAVQTLSWSAEEGAHSAAAEDHEADAAHHGDEHAHDEHGHEEHHEEHPPELPDVFVILGHWSPFFAHLAHSNIKILFYSILEGAILAAFFIYVGRNIKRIPGKLQSFVELYVELIDGFVCGILGREIGRVYVPFLGTLAIYILFMNLCGLVPGFMSPTTVPQQTFGLSIMVFLYVQYTAFKFQGPKGYLFHLAGEPQDIVGWILSPLFLVLHILGEFIKPVSLGLRLFGNILGEHVLLGVFSLLGIALTQFLLSGFGVEHVWIGIPLHLLLVPIALLGSTIQATVFVVLSTIYIFLVLPHHEGHEGHAAH